MEIKSRYSFPEVLLSISANKNDFTIPEFVTEFVRSVAKSLPELVKINGPKSLLGCPEIRGDVIDLLEELEMLRNFSCFVSERFIEPHKSQHHVSFFTHIFAAAGHAAMLAWLYLPGLDPEEINVLLSDFLRTRIKPIQPCIRKIYVDVLQSSKSTILQPGWRPRIQNELAETNFLETVLHNLAELLTNSNSIQIVSLKDDLINLQKMLNLLKANVNHLSLKDLEFLHDIDTVIIDVGLLVYSFYNVETEKKEVMALGEVYTSQVHDLMGNICLTIQKAFQFNLPRIHGLGYVDFLVNNLKEFQGRYADSQSPIMNQLQIIQKELENLQPFFQAVAEERYSDLDRIQQCATQLINKAYEVEYIVGACIRNGAPIQCLERWLLDIIKEISRIRYEAADIHETIVFEDYTKSVTTQASSNLARSPRINEDFVGFEEVVEKLRNKLIMGTEGRDIISIVGMPGLGKTTLAYKLYNDGSVIPHFDIRAQCCVSQKYSRKHLLLAILNDVVVGEDSKFNGKQADELAVELRRALMSKRYLVLVDDLWETSAWDDLRGCFPDKKNGSRIILTTRNHEVSNYARVESEPHLLRMFHDNESWELLRKKVFGEESYPPLLKNIGQQIAKKCGQLPLSVALVAGILSGMEKKEECWQQMVNNFGTQIHKDSRSIIEQSYRVLPYHLRSCFLYFGAFPEDDVINVSKLIRLWISEGFIKSREGSEEFIKSREGKSLEDIAQGYLENLIGRNLVMGTKKSSRGKIKACQIHDLLHDFCKERANEENFLLLIKRDLRFTTTGKVYSHSSSDYCHIGLAHRMSIYGEGYHIREWSSCSCWSHVGSVILHNCVASKIVYNIFRSFRFLRVLDMEFTSISSLPADFIFLRYLSARTEEMSILSCVTSCWNLETLLLNSTYALTLPATLLEMVSLRHLHLSECNYTIKNAEGILYNLKTLSNPYFSCSRDAEFLLSRTPNLQDLRCEVKGIDKFNYNVLKFPTWIETLKLRLSCGSINNVLPFCISAPNLKNLTVVGFSLHPQQLSEIGSLQNLQVLKLRGLIFSKKGWEVRNDAFPQLKVLKLHKVCFSEMWTVEDDAFPNLERLVLLSCMSLKEIPICFAEVSSLKSIEVDDCEERVFYSARDIWETQVEVNQNSGFQLLIDTKRAINNSGDDESDSDGDDDDDAGNVDGTLGW